MGWPRHFCYREGPEKEKLMLFDHLWGSFDQMWGRVKVKNHDRKKSVARGEARKRKS